MAKEGEVFIVGAGISGLVLSRMLSKRMKVKVIEKKNEVGFIRRKMDLVENSNNLDNILEKLKIKSSCMGRQSVWHSKNEEFRLKLGEIDYFLFERPLLEMQLAEEAVDNGCELITNASFVRINNGRVIYRKEGRIFEDKADVIVGADGGDSNVANFVDVGRVRAEYLYAYGVTGKFNFESCIPHLYFDRDSLGSGYVYIAPNRLTTICAVSREDAKLCYQKFINTIHPKGKILNYFQGKGNIGGLRRNIVQDNVLLVGEAAGFIDPCFGFGFKYAIISSYLAGKSILENREPKLYEELVKDKIYPSIRGGMANRRFLEKLGDEDLDLILKVARKMQDSGMDFNHSNKEVIMNNKARLISIFLSNPRLFLLILKMIKSV